LVTVHRAAAVTATGESSFVVEIHPTSMTTIHLEIR